MGFASATLAALAAAVAFILAASAVAYAVVLWWLPRRNSSRLRAAVVAAARRASTGGPTQLHRLLDVYVSRMFAYRAYPCAQHPAHRRVRAALWLQRVADAVVSGVQVGNQAGRNDS